MDNLGEYIKNKRIQKGITIEDLSAETRLSIAIIEDIENGNFDAYKGDEAYVKMYLKKLSNALDLDVEGVTKSYIALTQEVKLAELQQLQQETEEKEETKKKGKKLDISIPKIDLKNNDLFEKKSKPVYEDQSKVKYAQLGIIVLMLMLIVGVIFFAISQTKNKTDDPKFTTEQTTSVDGNVSDENNTNIDTEENNDGTGEENTEGNDTDQLEKGLSIVRNGTLDFSVTIPTGAEELSFKAVFNHKKYIRAFLNEDSFRELKSGVYGSSKDDTVEVKIPLKEFESFRIHFANCVTKDDHFYINDQELPFEDADSFSGSGDLKITPTQVSE